MCTNLKVKQARRACFQLRFVVPVLGATTEIESNHLSLNRDMLTEFRKATRWDALKNELKWAEQLELLRQGKPYWRPEREYTAE